VTTKRSIHYSISPNEPGVALCGRWAKLRTRDKGEVTCADCLKLLQSPDYSDSQFVGKDKPEGR